MAEIIVDIGDNLVETIGCEFKSELVRCKECVHRKKNKFCLEHNRYEKNDDGFCSYGEREGE